MKLIDALELVKRKTPEGIPALRVFLACGFTPLHLQTFLAAHLCEFLPKHRIQIETGIFGDLIGSLERLEPTNFDAVAVIVEWSDIDPRLGIRSLGGWRLADLPDIVNSATGQVERLKQILIRVSHSVRTICSMPTLPLPPISFPPMQQGGYFDLQLKQVVASLAVAISGQARIAVLNDDALDERSPFNDRFDVRSEIVAGFPYKLGHASIMAELVASLVYSPVPKKGLITDLDDTLWAGILGEVGVNGISWSLDQGSQMHGLYQQFLASLATAGILIGVASKNDPAMVEQVFERKDVLLRKDEAFPFEVHWNRKSESVRRILKVWNIGPESVVFVDDSPMEVAEVKAAFPEMDCLLFPASDDRAVFTLLRHLRNLFGKAVISEEDSLRQGSIRSSGVMLKSLSESSSSLDHFLQDLKASISFDLTKQVSDVRALELINKTNQFNLNGRRFTDGLWINRLREASTFLLTVAYEDKFGSLGRIAAIMGKIETKALQVDVWVMSCRAFSRRIEYQCLKYLFERFNVEEIVFDYQNTPRNAPLQQFFAELIGAVPTKDLRLSRLAFFQRAPRLFHHVEETTNA